MPKMRTQAFALAGDLRTLGVFRLTTGFTFKQTHWPPGTSFLVAIPARTSLIPAPFPMKLLDRYLLRNFFEPFLICSFGFLSIWLVIDLADNFREFMQAEASLKKVAYFYLTQLPQVILISLPVGMLLALIFCLRVSHHINCRHFKIIFT